MTYKQVKNYLVSVTKAKQKSQYQLFWEAHNKTAELNNAFMDLVNDPVNPLTNEDLESLIKKRPHVYGRFSGLVGKLGKVQS
jgi:hypothetical protein